MNEMTHELFLFEVFQSATLNCLKRSILPRTAAWSKSNELFLFEVFSLQRWTVETFDFTENCNIVEIKRAFPIRRFESSLPPHLIKVQPGRILP